MCCFLETQSSGSKMHMIRNNNTSRLRLMTKTLSDEAKVRVFENKVMRKIYAVIQEENGNEDKNITMNYVTCTVDQT